MMPKYEETARHARMTAVLYRVGTRCSRNTKLSYGNFARCFNDRFKRLRRTSVEGLIANVPYISTPSTSSFRSHILWDIVSSLPNVKEHKQGLAMEPA